MTHPGTAGLPALPANRRAAALDETLPPPLFLPPRNGLPVLLSVPHSGRDYPAWLIADARHGRRALATLEDPLVDRLAWRAVAAGFGAVVARTPRGAIDCNRSPDEVDPAAVSGPLAPVGPRARHGLGIVPSRTARHGQLWRRPLSAERFAARLAAVHAPYHELIEGELAKLKTHHPRIVLLDLHSMPPRERNAPAVVIGNRHGATSDGCMADEAARIAEAAGYAAALNHPYAGGYIVQRHGFPQHGVHALQIEIDRSAYLARDLSSPGQGFDRVSRFIEQLASGLAAAIDDQPTSIAAE